MLQNIVFINCWAYITRERFSTQKLLLRIHMKMSASADLIKDDIYLIGWESSQT